MGRPVTLFTGQWADLKLEVITRKALEFGYDGLELACWGDHFDPTKILDDDQQEFARVSGLLGKDLTCHAISNHLVGQAVCDIIDERHKGILPQHVWGDGNPEEVNERAAEEMKQTARAAQKFSVKVVNGFTGSSIWHLMYSFPPVPEKMIEEGFAEFAARWIPILEVFSECGVKFALEVHPTEIAYDIYTAERALEAVGNHSAFGFNFDPSHLLWQGVDPVEFIRAFPDRIYHMHVKDAIVLQNGRNSILGSHLNFGDPRRGWDFRSPGRGGVNFEEIIRALNAIGYDGPLSVEWEDMGMDREHGAREACEFVKKLDFQPSKRAFDAAFAD